MTYFHYLTLNLEFFGNTKKQILSTINYYLKERGWENKPKSALIHPSKNNLKIRKLDDVNLECSPDGAVCHSCYVDARILPDFTLHVNAGAYDFIKAKALKLAPDVRSARKRGDLYKFPVSETRIAYVPEKVADALSSYNWNQHDVEIRKMLFKMESLDEQLGMHPIILVDNTHEQESRTN
ncbi:MAG: hypothetical protein ABIH72_00700 [archaeon]